MARPSVMLRNTRRNVITTTNPKIVSAAHMSEYNRAVFFIRLGTIDICNEAPYHPDYDKWPYNDQLNYESGRQNTGNLLNAAPEVIRRALAQQIVQAWPETFKGIPQPVEKALNAANMATGRAYPETIQPEDPNVRADVTRDARGRLSFKVPTVVEE